MDLWRLDRVPAMKAVMTPFPHTVDIDAPVTSAEAIMSLHGVRHVPVEENGEIVGVATDREVRRVMNPASSAADHARIQVRQVFVTEPYVVDLEERLDRVLLGMVERRIGSALVTRRGKLVGIFTTTDACRVLAESLRSRFGPRGGNDAA